MIGPPLKNLGRGSGFFSRPAGAGGPYSQKATQYDGVDDALSVNDDSTLRISNNLSFGFWINSTEGTNNSQIIDKYPNPAGGSITRYLQLVIRNGGNAWRVTFGNADGTANAYTYTSTVDITTNTWKFVVVTYASGVVRMYVDGVEDTGKTENLNTGATSLTTNAGEDLVFMDADVGTVAVIGKLDDVTWWDTVVLSAANITSLYNAGVPINPSSITTSANLVSHWRMGDGPGDNATTIVDQAGSNDATIINETTIVDRG